MAEVGEYVRLASIGDVPRGGLRRVEVGEYGVCLVNYEGTIYAFRDNCSHRDYPLSEGTLDGNRLECAWHGAQFDVTTGRAVRLPAIKPIRGYQVRVEDGDILVALPED